MFIFLEFSADSEYLLDKCQEKCSEKLLCGDICSGTCGECKQGRLHVPCEETCNKVNICNHTYVLYCCYIYFYMMFEYSFNKFYKFNEIYF